MWGPCFPLFCPCCSEYVFHLVQVGRLATTYLVNPVRSHLVSTTYVMIWTRKITATVMLNHLKNRGQCDLSTTILLVWIAQLIKNISTSHTFTIKMETIRLIYLYSLFIFCLLTITFHRFCWLNLAMVKCKINNLFFHPLNNTNKFIWPWIRKPRPFLATNFEDWRGYLKIWFWTLNMYVPLNSFICRSQSKWYDVNKLSMIII